MHLRTIDGQAYSFAEGRTGAGVTGATLVLGDGTRVEATTANGWFVAWWPGSAEVSSTVVSTSHGSVTEGQ
jgi:hypothetical protein